MNELAGVFIIIALFLFGMFTMRSTSYNAGYKDGQIDSLNGKIKFEKKENEKGETVWTGIKENKPK